MIIWLASYPKSGNTWVRSFLSAYLYSTDGKFDFSSLHKIEEFPQHDIINKFMNVDEFHNLRRVSKNWIKVQETINSNKELVFLKTHSDFCNIEGNVFTNKNNTLGIIYVVRDPRNVILSMSNHFGNTQEESLKILTNEKHTIYPSINKKLFPVTHIASWKTHYSSWKNCGSINKIIIKYEDLINNPKENFRKILFFLEKHTKIKYEKEKFFNSINSTEFKILKKYEDKYGFNMGQKNKFFHLGKENDWKSLLDKKINNEINSKFKFEMNELGYI